MKKIFLAFPGYQVTLKQKIKKLGNFEFWNLEKISEDEFITLIQKKIKPFNKNVSRNYFHTQTEAEYRASYKKSSWGMLLPNYNSDYLDGRYESLFAANLFSQYDLLLTFYVQSMGITVERKNISVIDKARFHGEDKKFISNKFIKFYNEIFPALMGIRWQAYEVSKWSREDWRLYIACLLFAELTKYQKSKQVMTWQAECADIVSVYETLLSRKANDNGQYKISQRIEVLLGRYYKRSFIKIKEGVKELFDSRNDFVHGSFFDRLKRSTKTYPDNTNMAQMPTFDFNFLETQAKVAKQVLVAFLYLKNKLKKRINDKNSLPDIIHSGIMDVNVRNMIQANVDEILKLLSFK